MNPEYLEVLRRPRVTQIIEKRSSLLARMLAEHNLPEPKSVEFAPLPNCDHKRCFVNVDRQVARAGGAIETGWLFWHVEDTSIYTEAHAVWITPQGRRRDITPQRLPPEKRILFLPDTRVAANRGVTTGYTSILSSDPRVIALERFRTEMYRAIEAVFPGVGIPYNFPVAEVLAAGDHVGLPRDVANALIDRHIREDAAYVKRYGA